MIKDIDSTDYRNILRQIISEIKSSRYIVASRVNNSMMQMYSNIGRSLSIKGLEEGYGSAVVKRLSIDLKNEFPDMTGFSPRNLWDMKRFYEFYSDEDEKLRQAAALLPWMHNVLIIKKVKAVDEARFYIESATQMGWSRNVLLNFIKAETYKHSRLLPKQHNFEKALPEHLQEQAEEMLKSTYSLDFLGIKQAVKERELEKRLVEKIKLFLLELGYGFTFIGNQYRLTLEKKNTTLICCFFIVN